MTRFPHLLFLLLPTAAWAEGTAELGASQALTSGTVLGVDILDSSVETMTWTGTGSVTVTDPAGTSLGSFASGDTISPTSGLDGAYSLIVGNNQSTSTGWDVTVNGAVDAGGRLFSRDWSFNAGSFASTAATSASFYAVVPGGDGSSTAVIELQLDGLAGYVYDINANRTGVDGAYAGRSVAQSATSVSPEFDIYLNPPSNADYASTTPTVSAFSFEGAQASTDVFGADLSCDAVELGGEGGTFTFVGDVEGTWHLQCDLDGDGAFEMVSGDDLYKVGEAAIGTNTVSWDGTDADGSTVAAGTYDCRLRITVGEFHYVGADIETSYPGLRLFEVDASGNRTGLDMFWNDAEVQSKAQTMPDGLTGSESSGEAGVPSGTYGDAADPNVNARSWGNWNSSGKGNQSYLDTFTWLQADSSGTVGIDALSSTVDSDADGLSDFEERCTYGSDPAVADTDGDGTLDGDQYGPTSTSTAATSGLESNGRLAHALARRLVGQHLSGSQPAPPPAAPAALASLVPQVGPRDSWPQLATPAELPAVTNALAALGVDYLDDDGSHLASLLLVETSGEAYEHTKPTCDRAAGSSLLGVHRLVLDGSEAFGATLRGPDGLVKDEVLTLTFVAAEDGSWTAWPTWLPEQAPVSSRDVRVVQAQVWAARRTDRDLLAEAVLEGLDARLEVVDAPVAWVGAVTLEGGSWTAELANPEGRELRLVADARWEDGSRSGFDQTASTGTVSGGGEPLRELTLVLEADGVAVDRVWVSDGSWVELSDADQGGSTGVLAFEDTACLPEERGLGAESLGLELGADALALAGCGAVEAEVADWVAVARTLQPALDLRERSTLLAWVDAPGGATLCVESTERASFRCAPVSGPAGGGWVAVDFASDEVSGLGSDPLAAASLVSLRASGAGHTALTAGGLAFSEGRPRAASAEEPGATGCQAVGAAPLGTGLLAGLLALGRRRRG